MRSRLAWAIGGFVLVALVVYRFLTRAAGPEPVSAPVPAPAAETTSEAPVAGSEAPETPADDAEQDSAPGNPDERIRALRQKLEEAREAPPARSPGEPAPRPAEAPLDDRRRAVHEAGRGAADAMRRAAERRDGTVPPGTARPGDPAGPAAPVDPAS